MDNVVNHPAKELIELLDQHYYDIAEPAVKLGWLVKKDSTEDEESYTMDAAPIEFINFVSSGNVLKRYLRR